MGSVSLDYLKQGFSSLVHQADHPSLLAPFILWLDLKVAEYKVNGFMLLDHENRGAGQSWLEMVGYYARQAHVYAYRPSGTSEDPSNAAAAAQLYHQYYHARLPHGSGGAGTQTMSSPAGLPGYRGEMDHPSTSSHSSHQSTTHTAVYAVRSPPSPPPIPQPHPHMLRQVQHPDPSSDPMCPRPLPPHPPHQSHPPHPPHPAPPSSHSAGVHVKDEPTEGDYTGESGPKSLANVSNVRELLASYQVPTTMMGPEPSRDNVPERREPSTEMSQTSHTEEDQVETINDEEDDIEMDSRYAEMRSHPGSGEVSPGSASGTQGEFRRENEQGSPDGGFFKFKTDMPGLPMVKKSSSYRCPVCSKFFLHNSSFNRHMKLHQGVFSHVCAVCGRKFTRREHFVRHKCNRRPNKPFRVVGSEEESVHTPSFHTPRIEYPPSPSYSSATDPGPSEVTSLMGRIDHRHSNSNSGSATPVEFPRSKKKKVPTATLR